MKNEGSSGKVRDEGVVIYSIGSVNKGGWVKGEDCTWTCMDTLEFSG